MTVSKLRKFFLSGKKNEIDESAGRTDSGLERVGSKREPPSVSKASACEPRASMDDPSVSLMVEDIEIIEEGNDRADGGGDDREAESSSEDSLIGSILLERYEIRKLIGKGGMGRVYKAYQRAVDRSVAIKILNSSSVAQPSMVERFRQEARAASRLSHPNTITIHDFGQSKDGTLFIVMEYLEGYPLTRLLKQCPTPDRILPIMIQICGSLSEAHEHGIVHRDLKPANILINRMGNTDDYVKVLDFGIAKIGATHADITKGGQVIGTPKYMSPELIDGRTVDCRSDIYSLGILLYELLSGVPVFEVNSPLAYFSKHLSEIPRPLEAVASRHPISKELSEIVAQMLVKDPNKRLQKISDLIPMFVDILQKEYDVRTTSTMTSAIFVKRPSSPSTAGDTATDLERLRGQLPENTDETSLLTMLAELYIKKGESKRAARVYAQISGQRVRSGDFKEAISHLLKALKLDARHLDAKIMLAQCYRRVDMTRKSISVYKELVREFEQKRDLDNLLAILNELSTAYLEIDDKLRAKMVQHRVKTLTGNGPTRSAPEIGPRNAPGRATRSVSSRKSNAAVDARGKRNGAELPGSRTKKPSNTEALRGASSQSPVEKPSRPEAMKVSPTQRISKKPSTPNARKAAPRRRSERGASSVRAQAPNGPEGRNGPIEAQDISDEEITLVRRADTSDVKSAVGSISVCLQEANQMVRLANFPNALAFVRKALILEPENVDALRIAAIILEQGGDALSQDERIWLKILSGARSLDSVASIQPVDVLSTLPNGLQASLEASDLRLIDRCVVRSVLSDEAYELAPFAISRTPITNADYYDYVKATGEIPPGEWYGARPPDNKADHPVVGITLAQAKGYAEWKKLRLPTVLEWECAARGSEGRAFPWGNTWDAQKCQCKENGARDTCAVTGFLESASPFGCLDMVGNVWEWTVPDHRARAPDDGYTWVMGGSFKHPCVKEERIAWTSVSIESAYGYLGFRCALSVEQP